MFSFLFDRPAPGLNGDGNKGQATSNSKECTDLGQIDVDSDKTLRSSGKNDNSHRKTDPSLPVNRVKNNDVPYTYKDACFLLDKFHFIIFEIVTLAVTLSFLVTISLSG